MHDPLRHVSGVDSHVVSIPLGVLRGYTQQDTQPASYRTDPLFSYCRKQEMTSDRLNDIITGWREEPTALSGRYRGPVPLRHRGSTEPKRSETHYFQWFRRPRRLSSVPTAEAREQPRGRFHEKLSFRPTCLNTGGDYILNHVVSKASR